MSFVGQFGSIYHAGRGTSRWNGIALYLAGVCPSAILSIAALDLVIGSITRNWDTSRRVAILVGALSLLLTVDGLRVWAGKQSSLGLERQTPYRWRLKGPTGVVSWGLDTGIPITTVRATALPAVGLLLVTTGYGSWWVGLGYGLGLSLGLMQPMVRAPGVDAPQLLARLKSQRAALGSTRLVLLPTCMALTATLTAALLP